MYAPIRVKKKDKRNKKITRNSQHFGDVWDQWQVQDQQDHIAHVHGDDHGPEYLRLINHQTRSRRHIERDQRTQQDCRCAGAGNTKRQQRHEGAGTCRIVGGLRRCKSFDGPFAEFCLLFFGGNIALNRIAQKRCDGRASTRQNTDQEA